MDHSKPSRTLTRSKYQEKSEMNQGVQIKNFHPCCLCLHKTEGITRGKFCLPCLIKRLASHSYRFRYKALTSNLIGNGPLILSRWSLGPWTKLVHTFEVHDVLGGWDNLILWIVSRDFSNSSFVGFIATYVIILLDAQDKPMTSILLSITVDPLAPTIEEEFVNRCRVWLWPGPPIGLSPGH